jgi:predicted metal-dependent HD superfamily phosphohydrolase
MEQYKIRQLTDSIETLKSTWESLLQPFQVSPRFSQKVFLELVRAYSSVGRFYHTLEHIQLVLKVIEEIRRQSLPQALRIINFPAIQLAAWFHDVIYDSKSKDNEEKSAEYAAARLTSLEIPNNTVQSVQNLILHTKNHQAPPADIDSQILLDADLAILGASELEYKTYAQGIRQEYAWVADELYRRRRLQVLQNLLQRERIYFTPQLFVKLESRARLNLQAEIATLSSQQGVNELY